MGGKTTSSTEVIISEMTKLYQPYIEYAVGEAYVLQHGNPGAIAGQAKVFEWYRHFLPDTGGILDWGCRHAPDACMIRCAFPERFDLYGCDFDKKEHYALFFDYALLKYAQISDVIALPYENESMDVVLSAGTLEHVAMDHESLKELYRILKPGGKLIISYLPNAWSVQEWRNRKFRKAGFHPRLYTRKSIRDMLLHTGFIPESVRFQTTMDCLVPIGVTGRLKSLLGRMLMLHKVAPCICVVARKVQMIM